MQIYPYQVMHLKEKIVTCPECGASFELAKGSDGFDLKPAQTVGEDWGQ